MSGLSSLLRSNDSADEVFIWTVRYIKADEEAEDEAQALFNKLQSPSVVLHRTYLPSKLDRHS